MLALDFCVFAVLCAWLEAILYAQRAAESFTMNEHAGMMAQRGRTEEAADALALLHYAFTHALAKFSARQLAFGCLVAEWNGKPWTDTSEAGLSRLRDELSAAGLTEGMVLEEVETVKKEWRRS